MSDPNNPPTASFAVLCPECGKHFSSPSLQPGAYARCTHCDAVFPYIEEPPNKRKVAIPAPPPASPKPTDTRPSDFDDDFEEDRPRKRQRRDDDDDEEDRPRKRRPAAQRDRDDDEEDRPRRSRSRDDDDDEDEDDRPRRKKRRRKKRSSSGEAFDLLDAIPMDYAAQAQLALPIAVVLNILVLIFSFADKGAVASIFVVFCIPFWMWACAATARSAGRSAFNGFYGIIGLIGFLIVHTTNQRG